jgi:NusA N-terminal domain.
MNKNILTMVDVVSNEKGVDVDVIFEALEAALASASRERYGDDWDIHVVIDRETGDYQTFRRWTVVDDEDPEFESPARQILLARAQMDNPAAAVGDVVEQPLESIEFGRIGAQKAKQVIFQRVREAERARIVEAYSDRVGELITGTVKRIERGNIIVDLGGTVEVSSRAIRASRASRCVRPTACAAISTKSARRCVGRSSSCRVRGPNC